MFGNFEPNSGGYCIMRLEINMEDCMCRQKWIPCRSLVLVIRTKNNNTSFKNLTQDDKVHLKHYIGHLDPLPG